jgi:hypothetical protein
MRVSMFSAMLAAGRPPPPFIDQGGQPTSMPRGFLSSVVVPAYSACDLKVVLVNPGSCMCRGDSCAYLEAASRVVLQVPTFGCLLYPDSRVWLTRELVLHKGWRDDIPSEQVSTASGMTPQYFKMAETESGMAARGRR